MTAKITTLEAYRRELAWRARELKEQIIERDHQRDRVIMLRLIRSLKEELDAITAKYRRVSESTKP